MGRTTSSLVLAMLALGCSSESSPEEAPKSRVSERTAAVEVAHLSADRAAWVETRTLNEDDAGTETEPEPEAPTPADDEVLIGLVRDESGEVIDAYVAAPGCEPVDATRDPSTLDVPADHASIQDAVDAARAGDFVRVAAGEYHEHLVLKTGVRLIGAGAAVTVLDGDGLGENLIDFTGARDVLVSGFTLRNVGQAVGCARPEDVLACAGDWYSAAVYADGHSVVDDQDPCNDASIVLAQNVIEDNDVGTMIYFQPYAFVTKNVFVGNRVAFVANHHGGARALVVNNTFYDNVGGALAVSASYLDIQNNVFVKNGNVLRQEAIQQGSARCNVLFDNVANGDRISLGEDGNVELDPLLIDPAAGDFRLGEGSPALTAGCGGPDGLEQMEAGAFGGDLP